MMRSDPRENHVLRGTMRFIRAFTLRKERGLAHMHEMDFGVTSTGQGERDRQGAIAKRRTVQWNDDRRVPRQPSAFGARAARWR